MHGDQIQERGLSFQVADGFERCYRVVVQCHKSKMFSIRRESSSIFAVRLERSEADA